MHTLTAAFLASVQIDTPQDAEVAHGYVLYRTLIQSVNMQIAKSRDPGT